MVARLLRRKSVGYARGCLESDAPNISSLADNLVGGDNHQTPAGIADAILARDLASGGLREHIDHAAVGELNPMRFACVAPHSVAGPTSPCPCGTTSGGSAFGAKSPLTADARPCGVYNLEVVPPHGRTRSRPPNEGSVSRHLCRTETGMLNWYKHTGY